MTRLLHRLFGCWPFARRVERPFSIHAYYECRCCGRRGVSRATDGYQPVDHEWLERGA